MNILKQSTAATIKLGPFIDDTDGKTAETALSIAQADVRLSKNGGDFAQKNSTTSATHDENGYYDIPLNATDTGTLGRLRVAVSKSGALPVWQDFLVVTANVYDTLCSTDNLDVNVTALADDVIKASSFDESTAFPLKAADTGATQVARVGADGDTLETLSDEIAAVKTDTAAILEDTGTTLDGLIKDVPTVAEFNARTKLAADYFDPAADTVANVTAVGTTTNLTNLPTMPADWITAAGLKADAVTKIQSGLATAAALTIVSGYVDELESRLTAARADYLDNLNVTGTLANTDNADIFKADVSGLATEAALAIVSSYVDELESRLTAIRAGYLDKLNVAGTLANTSNADAFKADTASVPQNVWSYHTRLLTNIGSTVESPTAGDPLNIYRDTTVLISLTNLGAIGVDDKLWFTVKDSVEEPDEDSIIQIDRLGLLYINGAPASQVEDGSITVLDDVLGNVEIKLAQRQAALLPLYEAYPAQWDIKILHSGIVSILNIGTLYIKGTPTRAIL